MLAFIPSAILILSGFGIAVLYLFRKGPGIPWLIAAAASLLAWVGVALLHWFTTMPLFVIGWNPVENFTNLIGFQLDLIAWPYGLALASVSLAVIFTAAAHIDETTRPLLWAGNLVLTGIGLLAIMAATPLTMILVWVMIDVFELIVLQAVIERPSDNTTAVYSFTGRLLSIFSISIAMILSRASGAVLTFATIPASAGIFIFAGVLLRLSTVPGHLANLAEPRFQRETGSLQQSVVLASALVLLARLPDGLLPEGWQQLLRIVISIVALYAAMQWFYARDETRGKPFWVTSIASLAVIGVLNGFQITSLVWGLVLLLMGSVITLYTKRDPRIQYIPALAILSFLGLPFTPAAGMWVGLLDRPFSIFHVVYLVVHIFLILGMLKHIFRPGENFSNLERWTQVVYPAGLLLLMLTHWVIATWGWPGSYTAGVWWAGLLTLVLIVTGYIIMTRTSLWGMNQPYFLRAAQFFKNSVTGPVSRLVRLPWIYEILSFLFSAVGHATRFISRLLEGPGAIIWILLLLAMLITILSPGGAS